MKKRKQDLQRLIDNTAAAHAKFYWAQDALLKYCLERWGFEPGDRDVDPIIDAVLGGCGAATGMIASDFEEQMDAET